MKRHSAKRTIGTTIKFIFLAVYLVIIIFPFVWMLLTSLKSSQGEIYQFPVKYLPENPSLENYTSMLWKGNFGRYMLNSVFVSSIAGICAVFVGILAAYVIARLNFRGKNIVLFYFLFTQMIPMFIMLAPLYQMLSKMNMINNIWTLAILYTNMMIPFSVVTLRGFFAGISPTIEEAAQIDGCGRLHSIFAVIFPIMLPGIAATFIFAFINSWNELFMAIMFIDVDRLKTIPVGLNALILKYDIKWGEMSAGTVMALVPTIILFAFAQKYMVEGLSAGSIKG